VPESDKTVLKSEVDRLRKRCAALERRLQAAAPDDAADILAQLDSDEAALHPTQSTLDDVSLLADEAEAIDGRLLFDPDGTVRYFGETSGATFLEYLKHFMLTLVPFTCQPDSGDGSSFVASIGQYQTFDSRPLPNPDVNPLWLPSPDEMTSMLAELRYYLQDGSGNFPSGGIHWQVPLASSHNKTNPQIREGGVILAAYHSRCPARLP
jgi:hypothetical protein